MSGLDLASYLLAAIAAGGNALANVMQRKASLRQHSGQSFSAHFLLRLFKDSTWLLGILGMVAAFGFQAAALGLGQLSAVELVITLEVPLTLLIASRVLHTRLSQREWMAILGVTVGMIVLMAALNPAPGDEARVSALRYVAAGLASLAGICALVTVSRFRSGFWRTACLGAATGTSFGLTASLMKAAIFRLSNDGVLAMLTIWQTYAAIGSGILGVLIMQWALHSGSLLAAQPGFTLMDPLVSILWGALVYDETTRRGGWLAVAAAGGIGLCVGIVLLGRSPSVTPGQAAVPVLDVP